jgi:uncharacterized membrane protein
MVDKKHIIAGLIILSFALLILSSVLYISKVRSERQIDPLELESKTQEQIIQYIYEKQADGHLPLYYIIPMFSFFGIIIGALVYYVMNENLEKKQKTIEYNTDVILKLLNPDERKVIRKIVENDSKIQQVEITYMEGFTKVKAHRVVESLVNKGLLTKETLGKMRMIRMNKEFYEILKNK